MLLFLLFLLLLLFKELFELYSTHQDVWPSEPESSFRDYLEWLGTRDRYKALDAWQATLADLTAPSLLLPVAAALMTSDTYWHAETPSVRLSVLCGAAGSTMACDGRHG